MEPAYIAKAARGNGKVMVFGRVRGVTMNVLHQPSRAVLKVKGVGDAEY
jgi:hypothetical protein